MKKPYKETRWIGVDYNGEAWMFTKKPLLIRPVLNPYWAVSKGTRCGMQGEIHARRGECFRVMVTEIPKRTKKGKKR